jgi:hypothetical protein
MSHFHPTRPPHRRKTNDGFGARPEAADFNMGFRSAPIEVIGLPPTAGPESTPKAAIRLTTGTGFLGAYLLQRR